MRGRGLDLNASTVEAVCIERQKRPDLRLRGEAGEEKKNRLKLDLVFLADKRFEILSICGWMGGVVGNWLNLNISPQFPVSCLVKSTFELCKCNATSQEREELWRWHWYHSIQNRIWGNVLFSDFE